MDSKRLFIAINFPMNIKEEITHFQKQLKSSQADVKWVAPENFHLTLKFLGETRVDRIPAIKEQLNKVASSAHPFAIRLEGTGVFPPYGPPKVVWLGIQGQTEELKGMQQSIDQALATVGVPTESRPFSAHLTLGRVRGADTHQLINLLKENSNYQLWPENIMVSSFFLMQSHLNPKGPNYKELGRFDLGK